MHTRASHEQKRTEMYYIQYHNYSQIPASWMLSDKGFQRHIVALKQSMWNMVNRFRDDFEPSNISQRDRTIWKI